jgi:hypothetical protein
VTVVYLAAPYASRAEIAVYRDELRALGLHVTASWIDEPIGIHPGTVDAATDLDNPTVSAYARQDMLEVASAAMFVLFTAGYVSHASASGGRHVETGIALAAGVPIIVVGKPENIFHRIGPPEILAVVPDWRHAVEVIQAQFGETHTGSPAREISN